MNLATALSLVVSLATVLTAYATGFLSKHPDISAVLVALQQILGHWLPAIKAEAKPEVEL